MSVDAYKNIQADLYCIPCLLPLRHLLSETGSFMGAHESFPRLWRQFMMVLSSMIFK
jgi:hypothetical protein